MLELLQQMLRQRLLKLVPPMLGLLMLEQLMLMPTMLAQPILKLLMPEIPMVGLLIHLLLLSGG
jgi:hypothetical protein